MAKNRNLNIAVIIPARGGSKGIPQKNIYPLKGKPLIGYTIEAALASRVTSEVYVSTDSEEISKIATSWGSKVINRPRQLSHDTASTESALIHAIKVIKETKNRTPEYILTLPPTSPLRNSETIKQFVSFYMVVADQYDAMISLTETRGDYWTKNKDDKFKRLFPSAPRRRQEREPVYLENSAIYITKTASLLTTNSILGKNCTGFIINEIEAIDINGPRDLQWAEFVLTNILNK